MPGWDGFKVQVRAIMESYPLDYDVLPKQLARAYDIAMKAPPAGDLLVGNPVLAGNVAGMELIFRSVFLQQATSPEQLDLIKLLAAGFVTYWTGATISPLKIPALAPIGATPPSLQNLSGLCTNPGTIAQIPPFVYKGEPNVDTFINNFITAADIHLRTVSGIFNVIAMYGIAPTAMAMAGVVPWLGFSTNASSAVVANQIAFDAAFLALGLGDRPDLLGNADAIVAAYNAQAAGSGASGGDGVFPNSKNPITDAPLTFIQAAVQIIETLEGGYNNPQNMCRDHPFANPSHKHHDKRGNPTNRAPVFTDPRFHKSGETMFGIDRVAGGSERSKNEVVRKNAIEFWKRIDAAGAWTNWPLYHIPSNPLKSELLLLAAKMQEPLFNSSMQNYVSNPELRALVPTNGKLMFNFAYASWNGTGWFKAFGRKITDAYNKGLKDPNDLAEYFVNMRVNNEGLIGNKIGGQAYSLIRQGGFKIASKCGITPTTTTELWAANVGSKLSRASGTTPA
jgi:hypothetical protein